ncbi:MAG TPA: endolytic transglycosylase MltG [Propionibacterium sp.]|nr:endolytic transglycosylase MltG [Propionibacterium sp.]
MTEPRRARRRDTLRDPETGQWDAAEIRHRLKGWSAVVVALAVVIGGGWFVGTRAWDAFMDFRTKEDYISIAGVEDIQLTIPAGSTMGQIAQLLEEQNVVKSADTFTQYARSRPDEAARIQAGSYQLRTEISAQSAFDRLLDPANIVRNMLRIPEGLRLSEALAQVAERAKIPQEELQAVIENPAELGLPEWAGGKAEGFLYPETYEVGADPTALSVLQIPVAHFKKVAAEIDFEARAAESPAGDPYQALIMASIVEREAMGAEDRAKVARVFYNRLEQGMPMQSDATTAYANNTTGRAATTDEERALDDPYNTYHPSTAGKLTPGPISSPERSALEAALAPAEGNWLFFVTVDLDTGETEFNDTLEAHNQSVAKLRAWCAASPENQTKCTG